MFHLDGNEKRRVTGFKISPSHHSGKKLLCLRCLNYDKVDYLRFIDFKNSNFSHSKGSHERQSLNHIPRNAASPLGGCGRGVLRYYPALRRIYSSVRKRTLC